METTRNYGRTAARFAAVQALFQIYSRKEMPVETVLIEFFSDRFTKEHHYALFDEIEESIDTNHFMQLVRGVCKVKKTLDHDIEHQLPTTWTLNRLELSTYCVLQCGAFELTYLSDIPTPAILNEYVDVAHGFLMDKGYAFVNAVLQAIALVRRPQIPT